MMNGEGALGWKGWKGRNEGLKYGGLDGIQILILQVLLGSASLAAFIYDVGAGQE